MNDKDLQLEKYNRVFTFGCSFTSFNWPTWANIIEWDLNPNQKFYNYGRIGSGNYYITHSVLEAEVIHKFTENDLLMIMFTGCQREDRFMHGAWVTPGNIYFQDQLKDLVKYWDDYHGYMRDTTYIKLLINYLQNKKIPFQLMSMMPIDDSFETYNEDKFHDRSRFKKYITDDLNLLKPSIYEIIFNYDWNSIQPRVSYKVPWTPKMYTDTHAHPKDYLEYLLKLWPETKFKQTTIDKVNEYHQKLLNHDVNINLYEHPIYDNLDVERIT